MTRHDVQGQLRLTGRHWRRWASAFLQRQMRLSAVHGWQAAPGLDMDLFVGALLLGEPESPWRVLAITVQGAPARRATSATHCPLSWSGPMTAAPRHGGAASARSGAPPRPSGCGSSRSRPGCASGASADPRLPESPAMQHHTALLHRRIDSHQCHAIRETVQPEFGPVAVQQAGQGPAASWPPPGRAIISIRRPPSHAPPPLGKMHIPARRPARRAWPRAA